MKNLRSFPIYKKLYELLSSIWVTLDEISIDNWIYWPVTSLNYNDL
jgi:hypothetical protein